MKRSDTEQLDEQPRARLAALIEPRVEEWGSVPSILEEVFRDVSPDHIAGAISAFCEGTLGAGIDHPEFFEASVGSVHGLRLRDGRRVVVKVHRPDTPVALLEASQTVQRTLVAGGFPCPTPLVAPMPLDRGVAVAETMLDRGELADAHDPAIRCSMAAGLAHLVKQCRRLTNLGGLRQGKMTPQESQLWPTPHDSRFDFEATTA